MKQPTGRALRAPLAGSPACVFAFVFVLIYVQFELIMKVINEDDDIFPPRNIEVTNIFRTAKYTKITFLLFSKLPKNYSKITLTFLQFSKLQKNSQKIHFQYHLHREAGQIVFVCIF